MPPTRPMPSAAAPRKTDPDYHQECAANLNEQREAGMAPWQQPWTPGTLARVEPFIATRPTRAATNKEPSDGVGA